MDAGIALLVGAGAVVLVWSLGVVALALSGRRNEARALARFVPDCLVLLRRLLADPRVPRSRKFLLAGTAAYLALPFDLVPDFLPVVGQLDDALLVALVLRSVLRSAGDGLLAEHWPGPPEALAVIERLGRDPTLLERGLRLEYATLGWNVVGTAVLLFAAVSAGSIALAGFGLDSAIEILASVVVVWQLRDTVGTRERPALLVLGGAFSVLALYVAVQGSVALAAHAEPGASPLGIGWTAATLVVMLALAAGKGRTGRALQNPVLVTEARVTLVDAYLAGAVLAGLALNAAAGWWWADPLAGFVIVFYGLREALSALRAAR